MTAIPTLSVITLTRNRARLLHLCLSSLHGQIGENDEIIVVDNNSQDETQGVIRTHKNVLPIRSFRTKRKGYPVLYNLAISKAKKDVLVFLDDDCIAERRFLQFIRTSHRRHKNTVFQGRTYSLPKDNIYANISEDHLQNWINNNHISQSRLRVIDNKNVSIPLVVLQRIGSFSNAMSVGSEDVDLGMRLFHAGISIIYNKSIVAYHHERTTYTDFIKQHLRIAQSHAVLDTHAVSEDRLGVVNHKTWKTNLSSFLVRERTYLYKNNLKNFTMLLFIYLSLVVVRLFGYYTTAFSVWLTSGNPEK